MDLAEVHRMEKVYRIVEAIKRQGDFDFCVSELEQKGLYRVCLYYSIDYDWLSDAERELLWQELQAMAQEVEFKKYYADIYDGSD